MKYKIKWISSHCITERHFSTLMRCLQVKHQQKLVQQPLETNTNDVNHETTQATTKSNEIKSKVDNLINLEKTQSVYDLPETSILDNSWKEIKVDVKNLPSIYVKLSKRNLTALVVTTAVAGYVMGPASFVPANFLFTILGTTLTSTAANTFNQVRFKLNSF
jgi:hypothetical protein